jgi:UDPglucose 6-dehydrogenase
VRGKTIAVLGLAFKPNTDDMRDAPSTAVITALLDGGAKVRVFDPVSMEQARPLMPEVTFTSDPYECSAGADAMTIVTEWDQFRALDFSRLKQVMKGRAIVDLRNVYKPEDVRRRGMSYVGVGSSDGGQVS